MLRSWSSQRCCERWAVRTRFCAILALSSRWICWALTFDLCRKRIDEKLVLTGSLTIRYHFGSSEQPAEHDALGVQLPQPLLYAPALGGFCGIRRRDCLSVASSSDSPAKPAQRSLPVAKRKVADSRVDASMGTFLWLSPKKSTSPAGAKSGSETQAI
jgi:hypothetical protein